MGGESFRVVSFDYGPLLQRQTRIAKLKSVYNSLLVLEVCKSTYLPFGDTIQSLCTVFSGTQAVWCSYVTSAVLRGFVQQRFYSTAVSLHYIGDFIPKKKGFSINI